MSSDDIGATAGKKGMKLARFDLIPPYPLWLLAEVYGHGAKKYADRNWERGFDASKSYGAMLRHAAQWQAGEDYDSEGQHHLASVAWHAFAILEILRIYPEMDDRPHKVLGNEPQHLESEVTNQSEIDAAKEEIKAEPHLPGITTDEPLPRPRSVFVPSKPPLWGTATSDPLPDRGTNVSEVTN